MEQKKVELGLLQIHAEGRKYETELTEKFKNRKVWKAPNPEEIYSVLPGTVLEILVKEGDAVAKGAPVMIYEAMKMHSIINSPFDGVVSEIKANVGDTLHKGALLMIIKRK